MANFKITYTGHSKVITRLCERVNGLAALGETHENAYYGDLGKEAYDHSQLRSGNPHNVTAADLGLENVLSQIKAIMVAIGMIKTWWTHNDEPITDHEGVLLTFHGVSAPDVENNLLWH